MGRRKIEIQPLTDDRNRTVTFVKRKAGLFKKAHELAVLCQVDLAVVIIGNNNKVYEFSLVDTNELFKHYQNNLSINVKPQELKSPENYGNYKKKAFLHEKLTKKSGGSLEADEDDDDSEYDSETPEPKRAKRTYSEISNSKPEIKVTVPKAPAPPPHHISMTNMPTFNQPSYRSKEESQTSTNKANHKLEDSTNSVSSQSLRPVLRVQIPSDSKGNNSTNKSSIADSAMTISALDTNLHSTSNGGTSSHHSDINTATLNVSSHNANQQSSAIQKDSSTNNSQPPPLTNRRSNYSSFKSPDSNRKPVLPMIIQSKSQSSSPLSATAPPFPMSMSSSNPNGAMFYSSMPQQSPSSAYPGSTLPTPLLNQVFNSNNQNQNPSEQANNSAKFRSPVINNQGVLQYQASNGPLAGGPPNGAHASNGEQTPVSGLPSKFVNDMFPSPSNFYAPHDWSNPPGMTPINTNMPLYYMGMLPSAGAGGPNSGSTQFPEINKKQLQHQQGNQNRDSTVRNENLPSPLHFISNNSFSSSNPNPANADSDAKKG